MMKRVKKKNEIGKVDRECYERTAILDGVTRESFREVTFQWRLEGDEKANRVAIRARALLT